MKRVFLLLLALVVVGGMVGCGGDGDGGSISNADVAGIYTLRKVTLAGGGTSVVMEPPTVTGTLELTSAGRFTWTMNEEGDTSTVSGTYSVSDSTIVLSFVDEGEKVTMSGPIAEGSSGITLTQAEGGYTLTIEFVRT